MGSVIDMSVNLDTAMMGVSQNVLDASCSARSPAEALGNCVSNCEDDAFHMEISPIGHDQGVVNTSMNGEDVEVDVVGNLVADEGKDGVVERDSQETTENSSSFGFTDSGSRTADASGDIEVESELRDDKASLMSFDRFTDIFGNRKKKVTPHWRQYIRPIMWRCKWAELRIRELQYQASKYCKEIRECDNRKQFELEKYATEDNGTKSAPFLCQNVPGKVMKRKKRKRVEETTDLVSYTKSHSLLSYLGTKKPGADSTYLDDDHCRTGKVSFGNGEFGIDSLEFKDSDAFESVLRKVEEAQVHVRQLRERMDKVVRECTENFASEKSSFGACGPSTNCGPKSVLPHLNDEAVPLGSMTTTCQWPSNKLAYPETTVSISGEVTPLPCDIKATDHRQIGMKSEEIENKVLICNRPVKEEFNNTEELHTQSIAESFSVDAEEKAEQVQHAPDPTPPSKVNMFQERPTVKVRSSSKWTIPKNKRKRGRRKARTGRWSRKSSG